MKVTVELSDAYINFKKRCWALAGDDDPRVIERMIEIEAQHLLNQGIRHELEAIANEGVQIALPYGGKIPIDEIFKITESLTW